MMIMMIIHQTVNEIHLTPRKSVVRQKNVSFWRKLDNLRISLDICHVRMTDIGCALAIYGHGMNLLNNSYRTMYVCSTKGCLRVMSFYILMWNGGKGVWPEKKEFGLRNWVCLCALELSIWSTETIFIPLTQGDSNFTFVYIFQNIGCGHINAANLTNNSTCS